MTLECTIEACDRPRYGRGLCALHYQRWRKNGDPLVSKRKVGRSQCTIDGCDEPIVGRGLCKRHYKKPERPCSVDGCQRLQTSHGLCNAHAIRLRKYGDVQAHIPVVRKIKRGSRVCAIEGCERLNHYGDVCLAHYQRIRKTGDAAPDRPISLREPGRVCEVVGCDRPHKSRGYCRAHAMRLRSHGDVQAGLPIFVKSASQWIKDHANYVGEECLTWPFARIAGGTGSVTGRVVGRRGNISASRAMCILAHGEPPTPKHVAAHTCGKGHEACVNPQHLRWATMKENAADTLLHGTRPVLVARATNRLTPLQVKAVRLLGSEMQPEELATVFRVELGAIYRALKVSM